MLPQNDGVEGFHQIQLANFSNLSITVQARTR